MTDAKMRYVRVRCPFCGAVSPTVDQLAEPHRRGLADWWEDHKDWHMGGPRIEIAPAPEIQGYCGEGHPTDTLPCPACVEGDRSNVTSRECEDCGTDTSGYARWRCPNCGLLVCSWCKHHIHQGGGR